MLLDDPDRCARTPSPFCDRERSLPTAREAPRTPETSTLVAVAPVETMDHGACNVIYIDRRANDEHVRRESLSHSLAARTSTGSVTPSYFGLAKAPPAEVHSNVDTILSAFSEGTLLIARVSCAPLD